MDITTDKNSNEYRLKQIISEYSGLDESSIDDTMSLSGDIGIDSFGMISMVSRIEDEFDTTIPEDQLYNFQTLKDLEDYLNI